MKAQEEIAEIHWMGREITSQHSQMDLYMNFYPQLGWVHITRGPTMDTGPNYEIPGYHWEDFECECMKCH